MKSLIQAIFSIKRQNNYKVITLFGLKLKYKSKRKTDINKQILELYNVINNINYKQNLIFDYFLNASDARPATGALRKRQLENVELLKEFKRICDKHNLEYWLDYGSLLGAKRHNGFVPWDDDLDVSMDKENLDKFKAIVGTELNSKYKFKFYMTCYNRLLFNEDNGAFLDIYEYTSENNRYRIGENNIEFTADKYSTPKDIMYPLNEISFEGISVKCPNDVDTYLRIKYGNYELLPKATHGVPGHNPIQEYKIFYEDEV